MGKIIAIDGPAGSGKSTTAKLVAKKLSWLYVDTGAMYRAVTYLALHQGISISDHTSVAKLANAAKIRFQESHNNLRVFINDMDVTEEIRTPDVTENVSEVSAIPEVRKRLVEIQREIGKDADIVMEGRDIGTCVFPDADYKFYLIASIEERARRRARDFKKQGKSFSLDELIKAIEKRDKYDSTREHSPLKKAPDAVEVDTTNMTIKEQVDFIVRYVLENSVPKGG